MLYVTCMKRLWIAGVTLALLCCLSQRLAASAITLGLLDGSRLQTGQPEAYQGCTYDAMPGTDVRAAPPGYDHGERADPATVGATAYYGCHHD